MPDVLELESSASIVADMMRHSMLLVNEEESPDDTETVRLVIEQFGSDFNIVHRTRNGFGPELVASGVSYVGLEEIKDFVSYINDLLAQDKEE